VQLEFRITDCQLIDARAKTTKIVGFDSVDKTIPAQFPEEG